FLMGLKPAPLTEINTLPSGQIIYSATEFGPSLLKSMAPMIYGVAAEGESQKAVQSAVDDLVAAGNQTSLSAASFPMSSIQSATFQDPNKAVEGQLKLFRALGEGAMFQNSAIKGKPEIKENDQTYKGLK